jgi:hypothetical protein
MHEGVHYLAVATATPGLARARAHRAGGRPRGPHAVPAKAVGFVKHVEQAGHTMAPVEHALFSPEGGQAATTRLNARYARALSLPGRCDRAAA